jgi:hypothetical protein
VLAPSGSVETKISRVEEEDGGEGKTHPFESVERFFGVEDVFGGHSVGDLLTGSGGGAGAVLLEEGGDVLTLVVTVDGMNLRGRGRSARKKERKKRKGGGGKEEEEDEDARA